MSNANTSLSPAERLAKAKVRQPAKVPAMGQNGERKAVLTCRVGDRRRALKLSCREVAAAIDTDDKTVRNVEAGFGPSLTTALRLAAFFGATVEELWQEIETPK